MPRDCTGSRQGALMNSPRVARESHTSNNGTAIPTSSWVGSDFIAVGDPTSHLLVSAQGASRGEQLHTVLRQRSGGRLTLERSCRASSRSSGSKTGSWTSHLSATPTTSSGAADKSPFGSPSAPTLDQLVPNPVVVSAIRREQSSLGWQRRRPLRYVCLQCGKVVRNPGVHDRLVHAGSTWEVI